MKGLGLGGVGLLLAIDVGNTNIVLGVFEESDLRISWRLSTDRKRTADEFAMIARGLFGYEGIQFRAIDSVAISCVVPPLVQSLDKFCLCYLGVKPLMVGPDTYTGLEILYENPREVGADRIVNAVAAYERFGGPVVVVDFGTATTFDVISESGAYVGGAIAPGIGISVEALFERAAKLPRIELVKPRRSIGRDTVESMLSGIVYGYVSQVDGLVRRIEREMGRKAFVVATGGLAELISSESETIQEVDPLLTLRGLKIVYERNRDKPV